MLPRGRLPYDYLWVYSHYMSHFAVASNGDPGDCQVGKRRKRSSGNHCCQTPTTCPQHAPNSFSFVCFSPALSSLPMNWCPTRLHTSVSSGVHTVQIHHCGHLKWPGRSSVAGHLKAPNPTGLQFLAPQA